MVVDENEWKTSRGNQTIDTQICDFLKNNYPLAYDPYEITNNTVGKTMDLQKNIPLAIFETWIVWGSLEKLKKQGEIESKLILGKGNHYRYKK